MLSSILSTLFFPLFFHPFLSNDIPLTPPQSAQRDNSLKFELRHYHAVSADARVVFANAPPSAQLRDTPYTIRTRSISTFRPPSFDDFLRVRSLSWQKGTDQAAAAETLRWDEEETVAPDVESRETLHLLAKMTNNAYVEPGSAEWYELDGNWTVVCHALFIFVSG
jgi:lipase ATG15